MNNVQRKLPHTASVEELLKTIEDDETPLSEEHDIVNYPTLENDLVAFLSFYEIEPGNDVVPKAMLYKLYGLWSDSPITRNHFGQEMAKFVLSHVKGAQTYYLLNKSSIRLTKAAYDLINKHTRDLSKSPPWKAHFENFLNKYEIKAGYFFIESYALYDLYDEYVYSIDKKRPLGYRQFVNICKIYFKKVRITSNKVMWFGVDKSITNFLTPERLASLRKNRKIHHGKKKNEEK